MKIEDPYKIALDILDKGLEMYPFEEPWNQDERTSVGKLFMHFGAVISMAFIFEK